MKLDGSSSSFTSSSAWLSSFPPVVPPHAQLDTARCLSCSSFKPLCRSPWSLLSHGVTANDAAERCLRYRSASPSSPVRPIGGPSPPSVICRTFRSFLIIPAAFHHGHVVPAAGSASARVCSLLQSARNQGGHRTHPPPPTPQRATSASPHGPALAAALLWHQKFSCTCVKEPRGTDPASRGQPRVLTSSGTSSPISPLIQCWMLFIIA